MKLTKENLKKCSPLCVSIAERGYSACKHALLEADFAEIRLDQTCLSEKEILRLFALPKKLIATCRSGALSLNTRKRMLLAAIRAGASFVDIEVESAKDFREEIIKAGRKRGCKIIVSFHDYKGTPSKRRLENIIEKCFLWGADIAKISCAVRNEQEGARLISLLDDSRAIVVTGMGKAGSGVRIAAALLGSPICYVRGRNGPKTASGQLHLHEMRRILLAASSRS